MGSHFWMGAAFGGLAMLALSAFIAGMIEGSWWTLWDYYNYTIGNLVRRLLGKEEIEWQGDSTE